MKNKDYSIAVKFTKDILYCKPRFYFEAAYFAAPPLKNLNNLNETPVAYKYPDREDVQNLNRTEYNEENYLDRVEFYWKKLNSSEWQIEIEQVINKAMVDYSTKFGLKYFHGVYSKKLSGFVHADISVRVYGEPDFRKRYEDTSLDIKTFGKN